MRIIKKATYHHIHIAKIVAKNVGSQNHYLKRPNITGKLDKYIAFSISKNVKSNMEIDQLFFVL